MRNGSVETAEVHKAIFFSTCPKQGAIVVPADRTDLHPYKSLILSLIRDGRSIQFYRSTVWLAGADDPWYLVTDLQLSAGAVVSVYWKRMWTEATFRDLKERE